VRPVSGTEAGAPSLGFDEIRRLRIQRWLGRVTALAWAPLAAAVLRLGLGWRIEGVGELRARYRRLRASSDAPLLVCANHLTLVDSFLVASALGSPWWYVRHYSSLPWNTPERTNFATSWWMRTAIYLMKCVPIERGGDRGLVAGTLARLVWLLGRGDAVLLFPEGGRSRTGRVDPDSAAYGVGRVLKAVPGCRVLCVYLRGDRQDSWSDLPVRGERFRVELSTLEPKSDRPGLRGSVEIARQIVGRLVEMEERFLDR
jgi:1-acyl-sn-glycerol-3-phosphate acyltransferase